MEHLCYFCLVFVMLSRLFIAALWSPAGKGLTSWLLFVMFNCVFVCFPCGILGQVWYIIVSIPDLLPIGQRPIALLDSSKSINIKSISTAATIYLMSTALQNCKINCLYSVLPGKLEVIMLIALINWYKSHVLFYCQFVTI